MLAKLKLDQGKTYEQCIAVYETAKMLCAFVEGREHIQSIGAEQGNIAGWDDFVIEINVNFYEHIQVKRQQTNFSGSTADCVFFRTKNASDQNKSTLDKPMESLALWIKTYSGSDNPKRQFTVELPESSVEIKKSFLVRHFKNFIQLYIRPTTTVKQLQDLQNIQKDPQAINVYNWLTTWCGFNDWNHILKALSILTIKDSGTEPDINSSSIELLSRIFKDAATVMSLIQSYVQNNSTYTGALAPRHLLFKLKEYLLPDLDTWTQFENNAGICKISGIHDLEHNNEVERPSKIVPLLWDKSRIRHLKINSKVKDYDLVKPMAEIFQLAIHLRGTSAALCVNWIGWQESIRSKIGNTLGVTKDDFDNFNISDNPSPCDVSEAKTLDLAAQDSYSTELNSEIIKFTWLSVNEYLNDIFMTMSTAKIAELRNAVIQRWEEWKKRVANDLVKQKEFFLKLLHPAAEGKGIHGQLRIGPKTARLIADGLYLLLVMSVALSDDIGDWNSLENGLSLNAIGLNFWSGPSDGKGVRPIDEEQSVADLIGKELSDILIISQSRFAESEIFKTTLDGSRQPDNSLASPHRPKLLITHNNIIKKFINEGSIAPFRNYLNKIIISNATAIKDSIKQVTL